MISLSPKTPDHPSQLSLSGTCDVRSASDLQTSLCELLRDEAAAIVNCTAVDSIDTACIQLLIAAKRESSRLSIQFERDSEASRWFELAGVANFLSSDTNPSNPIPDWALPSSAVTTE